MALAEQSKMLGHEAVDLAAPPEKPYPAAFAGSMHTAALEWQADQQSSRLRQGARKCTCRAAFPAVWGLQSPARGTL